MAESNPGLAQIIGRHLDVDLVADADADKVFAHFAGDVSEDLMPVGQGDTKHRAGQHLAYRAHQLDWFFFGHPSDSATQAVAGAHLAFSYRENQGKFSGRECGGCETKFFR